MRGCRKGVEDEQHRPLRDSGESVGRVHPALKRWANEHCAYGAGGGLMLACDQGAEGQAGGES